MDEVEDIEKYRPGGLAPLTIGDVLANRFQIIHKLGYGGIATVWLCFEPDIEKWHAIKINAASHSGDDCSDVRAIRLLEERGITRETLEKNHICTPLEYFWEETLNGKHFCTVMPILGSRLSEWREDELEDDGDRINDISYQMTEGLSFLHEQGLCHGDFRPQNILMKLRPNCLDHLSRDEMWDYLGDPEFAVVRTVDGETSPHAPDTVVTSAPWQRFWKFMTDEIAIVDFGEAYLASDPPKALGIPEKYAAPEVLFREGRPGFPSDVWSLAISLLEIRVNDYEGSNRPFAVMRQMERYAGPMPAPYREAAKGLLEEIRQREFEDDEGESSDVEQVGSTITGAIGLRPLTGDIYKPLNRSEDIEYECEEFNHPLERKLGSTQHAFGHQPDPDDPSNKMAGNELVEFMLPREEVRQLGDLLRQMFKYAPEERIILSDALSHPWFNQNCQRAANLDCSVYYEYR
ncbi:kinase-like protein [Xylariaceae sp. FL0016]|nr:kinase-like protein [Xylariaceae sp. FL0016]